PILGQHRNNGFQGGARLRAHSVAVSAFDSLLIDSSNHVNGRLFRPDFIVDKRSFFDISDPLELRLPRFRAEGAVYVISCGSLDGCPRKRYTTGVGIYLQVRRRDEAPPRRVLSLAEGGGSAPIAIRPDLRSLPL